MADNNELGKRVNDLEIGQAELRIEQKEMKQDLTDIKAQVTNHLPHQIDVVQSSVDAIAKRHESFDAIAWFVGSCFKVVLAIAGTTWTIIQIAHAFHK